MKTRLIVAISAIAMMMACSPKLEQISRVRATDKDIEAAAFALRTDATVPTPIEVYVLPAGNSPSGEAIWRADKVRGLTLSWPSSDNLIIQAEEARVFFERDHIEVPIKGNGIQKIVVSYRIERKL